MAAAYSGDERLKGDYASGDNYHALAWMCGLTTDTNIKRWKDEHHGQRKQMKSLQLGINYGMGVRSLAKGLGRHRLIASEVLVRHRQRYPTYWGMEGRQRATSNVRARDRIRIRWLAATHQHLTQQADTV